jgi:MerR family transcriptional regulator, heat shock protein HspR
MSEEKNREPRYVISIAARMVGSETHTLRYYEKIGLVQPYRSEGKIRYYSESDIEQLRYVRRLVNDLGVNPAGVEVVIRMAKMVSEMQGQITRLTEQLESMEEKPVKVKRSAKKGER